MRRGRLSRRVRRRLCARGSFRLLFNIFRRGLYCRRGILSLPFFQTLYFSAIFFMIGFLYLSHVQVGSVFTESVSGSTYAKQDEHIDSLSDSVVFKSSNENIINCSIPLSLVSFLNTSFGLLPIIILPIILPHLIKALGPFAPTTAEKLRCLFAIKKALPYTSNLVNSPILLSLYLDAAYFSSFRRSPIKLYREVFK